MLFLPQPIADLLLRCNLSIDFRDGAAAGAASAFPTARLATCYPSLPFRAHAHISCAARPASLKWRIHLDSMSTIGFLCSIYFAAERTTRTSTTNRASSKRARDEQSLRWSSRQTGFIRHSVRSSVRPLLMEIPFPWIQNLIIPKAKSEPSFFRFSIAFSRSGIRNVFNEENPNPLVFLRRDNSDEQ